jgi:hypothetical protein
MIDREENLNAAGIGLGGGITTGDDPRVTVYVEVPDVEAALASAERLGGTRVIGPLALDEHLEIGLFNDPEEHLIGVIRANS